MAELGTVKFYDMNRGFGFITPKASGPSRVLAAYRPARASRRRAICC
jgi:hypothetical protein